LPEEVFVDPSQRATRVVGSEENRRFQCDHADAEHDWKPRTQPELERSPIRRRRVQSVGLSVIANNSLIRGQLRAFPAGNSLFQAKNFEVSANLYSTW
jgi:hypothetical protein